LGVVVRREENFLAVKLSACNNCFENNSFDTENQLPWLPGSGLGQPITVSLPTRDEDEMGCDKKLKK
jgi:hypothetical protein